MNEIILMMHVLLGMFCVVGSVWVFAETLHAGESNQTRIRVISRCISIAMFLAFVVAGYWYVNFYPADKAVILGGPWPFAHNFVMETKEHIAILLLLLTTYLTIVAGNDLARNADARKLVLWVSGLIFFVSLAMEGEGALIAMGVKVALMSKK